MTTPCEGKSSVKYAMVNRVKNVKLEDQLSLMSFLILVIFKKLYLVNLCPIFVGSFQNLSDSWEENNYLGLISVQNFTFA